MQVFVFHVLEYLFDYLFDIVICFVLSCVICYFKNVVQIMEGVLRMYVTC